MPSPFPGMDPYLEGYLWSDVHQALAYQVRRQLAPLVEPKYAVRLAITMVTDRVPVEELGVMYPDLEVVRTPFNVPDSAKTAVAILPAPVTVDLELPVEVRLVTVEIRDVARNGLVTAIEILSPANKREPGLSQFLEKRDLLRLANVHVLEIDLLRSGTRPWRAESLPCPEYLVALVRAGRVKAELWPIRLRDRLPPIPVPLRRPDADVPLDLQQALDTVYDEARYALTLDYDQPPTNPPLTDDDLQWLRDRIRALRDGR